MSVLQESGVGRTGGPVQEQEQQQLESDKIGERGALRRGVLSSLPESNLNVAAIQVCDLEQDIESIKIEVVPIKTVVDDLKIKSK